MVKGLNDQCSYQITYSAVSSPIIEMQMAVPYQVSLGGESLIKYFLFYNQAQEDLRVIQIIDAGVAYMYATPLNQEGDDI